MIPFGIFLIIAGASGIFSMFSAPILIHPGTQALAGVILIALGLFLIYLKSTEGDRGKEYRSEVERKKVEKLRADGQTRFKDSTIFKEVLRDLQSQRWAALYHPNGCQILCDRVVLPYHEYRYKEYGFDTLDTEGCAQFAYYLQMQYSGTCTVDSIRRVGGSYRNSCSGYIDHNGNSSVYQDGDFSEYVIGYKLTIPKPKEAPLKKW